MAIDDFKDLNDFDSPLFHEENEVNNKFEMKEEEKSDNNSQCWSRFLANLKDPDLNKKPKDRPRSSLHVDADLYKTLQEIDFDGLSPTNLMNMILRSFMETYIDKLIEYRKPQVTSVFSKVR